VATQAAFLFVCTPHRFPGPLGHRAKCRNRATAPFQHISNFGFFDFCFNQQRKCWTDIRFIGGLLILYGYMFASEYAAQLQWLARLFYRINEQRPPHLSGVFHDSLGPRGAWPSPPVK
jgi:hypothetical protein